MESGETGTEAGAGVGEADGGETRTEIDALRDELQSLREQLDAVDERTQPPPPRTPVPRLELRLSGRIQSEARFRVQEKSLGAWYDRRMLPVGLTRNENIVKTRLDAEVSRFSAQAELDFVFTGFSETDTLADLSERTRVEPFRVEAHNAWLQGKNLLTRGLDLRLGIQKVMWGMGDQFNPTNTLNADDLEDPLLFGEQQGNLMFKLDYSPAYWFQASAVLIPLFRPALLPPSGELALAAVDRLPFVDDELRYRVHSQNQAALELANYATVARGVFPSLPETHPRHMQFAVRTWFNVGGQDIALSFYRGFDDFPQPALNVSTLSDSGACENDPPWPEQRSEPVGDEEDCVDKFIETDVYLEYPRINVVGLNWAGEIPGAIGYRLELGVYLPERRVLAVYQPEVSLFGIPFTEEGEYDYDDDGETGGPRPEVIPGKPFLKWALGIDYTVGPVMLNAQWVHGFPDEFGAGSWVNPGGGVSVRKGWAEGGPVGGDGPVLIDCATEGAGEQCAFEITRPKIGDYLVFGADFRLLREALLVRLFTIWDLSGTTFTSWNQRQGRRVENRHNLFSKDGFSAIIFPEIQYNFGYGFELHAGALLQLGRDHTKFGDPAGGGSQVYLRGRMSF